MTPKNTVKKIVKHPPLLWDFDGTLCRSRYGYRDGTIYDKPSFNAVFTIKNLMKAGYECVILTARKPKEFPAMRVWLKKYGFPEMEITNKKIPGIPIDNRAIRFHSMADIAYYFL
jgi:hypothetical protein